MPIKAKSVYLPHIGYTVRFRPFRKPPDRIANAKAWVQRDNRNRCTVYAPKNESPSGLAHELVHVLWYICRDRLMDFEDEFEHMAYLMQYLMGQALGYEWVKDTK